MAEKQAKRILTASEIENIHKMPTARLTRELAELGFTLSMVLQLIVIFKSLSNNFHFTEVQT